jgi:hypothetical protein
MEPQSIIAPHGTHTRLRQGDNARRNCLNFKGVMAIKLVAPPATTFEVIGFKRFPAGDEQYGGIHFEARVDGLSFLPA